MRKVYLDNLAEFHCPLTGELVWRDGEFQASRFTRFIYVEPEQRFEYLAPVFAKAVTGLPAPYLVDGNESACFRRLSRGTGDAVIDFVLQYSSCVVHIGIDTIDARPVPKKAAQATVPDSAQPLEPNGGPEDM